MRAFAGFWYDFVIGDDWRVAVGVVLALAATFLLSRATTLPAWWLLPLAVVLLLPLSLRRAIRETRPAPVAEGQAKPATSWGA